MKVAHLLGLQGPWRCQVCRDLDCLHCRSYGPIRVFFSASYNWRSAALFGLSFSTAPPVQALKGLPCLGSFSVVWCIRHIEGAPGWGPILWVSASRVWWACLSIVQLPMLVCGKRDPMVMAPLTLDSAVLPCFHDCPASLHRHFPPQSPP